MNQPAHREVLECASPLALSDLVRERKSGRGLPQSKTLARQRPPRRGSWSQCMRQSERRLSMNPPAPDPSLEGSRQSSTPRKFPSWQGLGVGSWSQCAVIKPWRLSMNRSAELQLRQVRRRKKTLIAPGWSPALQFRGSWSQCMRKSERRLSMNRRFGVPASAGPDRLKAGHRTGDAPNNSVTWKSDCPSARRDDGGRQATRLSPTDSTPNDTGGMTQIRLS